MMAGSVGREVEATYICTVRLLAERNGLGVMTTANLLLTGSPDEGGA